MVYLNGALVPDEAAAVPTADRGLLYGDGLFETMRVLLGRPVDLDAHLDRLLRGCRLLGIALHERDALRDAVLRLIAANETGSGAARLTVTRGVGGARLDAAGADRPTVMAASYDYEPPANAFDPGLRAIVSTVRVDEDSPRAGLKTLNYLDNILARREARAAGADEALMLNTRGELACAAAANLFLVADGAWYTPPTASGCLPGITRARVLRLLREDGDVYEQPLPADAAGVRLGDRHTPWQKLSGMFLTNSLLGVAPVVQVGAAPVASGRPAVQVLALARAYESAVRAHCRAMQSEEGANRCA